MQVVEVAACYRRDSGACPSELSRFYLVVGVVVVGELDHLPDFQSGWIRARSVIDIPVTSSAESLNIIVNFHV